MGWRNIIEEMRQVATTKDWFAEKGRHQIYAGDRPVELPNALKRKLPVVAVKEGNGQGKANGTGNGHEAATVGAGSENGNGSSATADGASPTAAPRAEGGCGTGG